METKEIITLMVVPRGLKYECRHECDAQARGRHHENLDKFSSSFEILSNH